MVKLFYPYEYVPDVFSIDYKKLYLQGYKGIIFDIDNTLVHHGDNSTLEIDNLFREIHNTGFKTLLLSNNSEERILRFIENIDTIYIHEAEKPKTKGYKQAMKMLELEPSKVLFIGDQIFTDILGANLCNINNILVKFIQLPEETKIGKRRQLEKLIIHLYMKNKKYQHRLGNILKK